MARSPFALVAALLLLPLAACEPGWDNPYEREGTWKPQGTNEANLRAMADNPADLEVGQGTNTALGQTSAAAVRRLRTDKLKVLPDTQTNTNFGSASSSNAGGATGDAAGTQ